MIKLAVKADNVFNNADRWDGIPVQPVDLNAGLVVPKDDRCGMCDSCSQDIQDNISERFGL